MYRSPVGSASEAGAGKTTAMVHRIARLVGDRVFAPGAILRHPIEMPTQDLRQRWRVSCQTFVEVRIASTLGYSIVRMAQARISSPPACIKARTRYTRLSANCRTQPWMSPRGAVVYVPQLAALDGDDFLTAAPPEAFMLCFPDLHLGLCR
ncbi:MAG: hypothetical protein R2838_06330 [Caldilineaceae bacterium]